MEDP